MKQLVILARRHGSKTAEMISGPEVPFSQQQAKYKEFLYSREHPEFEYVELSWLDISQRRWLGKQEVSPEVSESLANIQPGEPTGTEIEVTPEAQPAQDESPKSKRKR